VFWMPIWAQYILEKAGTQRRVNLEQSRRQAPRVASIVRSGLNTTFVTESR
jgi:hypothetical protein